MHNLKQTPNIVRYSLTFGRIITEAITFPIFLFWTPNLFYITSQITLSSIFNISKKKCDVSCSDFKPIIY